MTALLILALVLGMLIGSFLGVVADRHNTGKTIGGRSFCSLCARTLRWYELVPVVSYAMQGGRCRSCRSVLSLRYPAIELVTGLVFMGVAWKFSPLFFWNPGMFALAFALYASLWSLLVVILFYDMKHMIIPDRFVFGFIVLALASVFLDPWSYQPVVLPGIHAVAYALLLPLPFLLLWLASRGRLLGFGDIKLMLGIGLMLGLSAGVAAVLIAFWSGAIASIVLLLLKKWRFTMKSEIPFAPFLIFGTLVVFLCEIDFWSLARFLAL